MEYEKTSIRSRAIDYTNQGIVITDPNQSDNPIVDVNKAFEKMSGYAAEEIIGKNCRFLQGDDHEQPAISELRRAIETHQDTVVLLKNYRKDGTMFWNELAVAPIYNDEGAVTYFVGVQQDVTERQLLQEQLAASNKRLEEMNDAMVDRELKMVALKKELAELEAQRG